MFLLDSSLDKQSLQLENGWNAGLINFLLEQGLA